MRLEDKVTIVTGAGGGIGQATAVRFAKEGARVIAIDLDEAGIAETIKLCTEGGGTAIPAIGNVTVRAEVQKMIDTAINNYGRLDIVINNAGITRDGLTLRIKDGETKMMTDDQ